MKKIIVRKILRYDPTIGGKYSKYEGYSLIGMRMEDPGIMPGQKLIEANIKAFRSPRKRAEESINRAEISLYLDEVKFDLKKLVSEKEYEHYSSNLVRARFCEKFVNDELDEKRREIKARVAELKKLLTQDVLLVSHSFFMKILEADISEPRLFENPVLLSKYLKPDQKTYNFGEGFEFFI